MSRRNMTLSVMVSYSSWLRCHSQVASCPLAAMRMMPCPKEFSLHSAGPNNQTGAQATVRCSATQGCGTAKVAMIARDAGKADDGHVVEVELRVEAQRSLRAQGRGCRKQRRCTLCIARDRLVVAQCLRLTLMLCVSILPAAAAPRTVTDAVSSSRAHR